MSASTIGAQQGGALVRGRTANRPFRKTHEPTALCVVDPEDVAVAVNLIREAIRKTERSRGCGAYLYVSPTLRAFVVTEERQCAAEWINTHFAWLVGYYRTHRCADASIPLLRPTLEGIHEDLQDHLLDLARLRA